MADNIYKNNFYSLKQVAWHNKGIVGQENESALSVYSRMEQVDFERHPFTLNIGNTVIKNNVFGIIRRQGDKVVLIGTTKDRYELKQPIEYLSKFDEVVGKPVETVGFLGSKAEKLFLTWNLPEIDVKGDKVEMYGLLSFGFDGVYGNHLFVTSVRTVCQNTHNLAVQDAAETNNHGRGKNSNNAVVTAKHNQKDHLDILGYWMSYVDKESERQVEMMKSLFVKMEEKPLTTDDAYGFFAKVFPYPDEMRSFIPPELVEKERDGIEGKTQKANEQRDLAMSLFQGAGIGISPSVWGAYNTVTEMQNHHILAKKNDGVDSLLLGGRAKVMDNAYRIAMDYVTVR
jgi:hypothetical protein